MKKSIFSRTKYNPDIRWIDFESQECFYFYFKGVFREKDAEASVKRGVEVILSRPKRDNILICDFSDVTDYETEARNILQNIISEYRDYVGKIYVITKSPIIFAAVEIVSFFTSMNIKVVGSIDKLKEKLDASA